MVFWSVSVPLFTSVLPEIGIGCAERQRSTAPEREIGAACENRIDRCAAAGNDIDRPSRR